MASIRQSISMSIQSVTWPDINFMVPGAIYGDPTYDGDRFSRWNHELRGPSPFMREDIFRRR